MYLSENQINIIKNYFEDKPILKAYIFGSYSRGEATDKSDLDILVELDYSQHIGLKFFNYVKELEKILNLSVDLVQSKSLHWYVKESVEKEKLLFYEKK